MLNYSFFFAKILPKLCLQISFVKSDHITHTDISMQHPKGPEDWWNNHDSPIYWKYWICTFCMYQISKTLSVQSTFIMHVVMICVHHMLSGHPKDSKHHQSVTMHPYNWKLNSSFKFTKIYTKLYMQLVFVMSDCNLRWQKARN